MKSTTMHSRVRAYLAHRRKLGFALRAQAYHLKEFAAFADREAAGQPLTTTLALQWAASTGHNRFGYHAMRYQSVRNLARYLAALDPRTEVPPARMLGSTLIRRQPHIYTPDQVRLMMAQSRQLPYRDHYAALRPLTFETMVGLVFCTGLRPAEACKLRLADFDFRARRRWSAQPSSARRGPCRSTRPSCGRWSDIKRRGDGSFPWRTFLRGPTRSPLHAPED